MMKYLKGMRGGMHLYKVDTTGGGFCGEHGVEVGAKHDAGVADGLGEGPMVEAWWRNASLEGGGHAGSAAQVYPQWRPTSQ